MNDTPNLALPYILASQAQKHVTHNEAIRALDCLVQLAVESRSLTAPPASLIDGSRYLVAAAATGDWAGQSEKIAAFQDGVWAFYEPREGWIAWVADDHELAIYSAGTWAAFSSGGGSGDITELDDLEHVGINATADTINRLSLKSPASLFDHVGNGHQQKINKNAAGDTASVLYQTDYSGRAEMGLTGDDDFHFKVSPNGSTWYEALKIDRNTGQVSFPVLGGPREVLAAGRSYYVRSDGSDSNNGLANTSGGAFLTLQAAVDACAKIDLNGFTATINIGSGTFAGCLFSAPWVGGNIALSGAGAANTTLSSSAANLPHFRANSPGSCALTNMKLTTAGSGLSCIRVEATVNVVIGPGMEFGAASARHMLAAAPGATISPQGISYTISGGASAHMEAQSAGAIVANSNTVTLSGTPAFTNFAAASNMGLIQIPNQTYSGSATGARYSATSGGGINTFGGGASYFPGSTAGAASTGGQYI